MAGHDPRRRSSWCGPRLRHSVASVLAGMGHTGCGCARAITPSGSYGVAIPRGSRAPAVPSYHALAFFRVAPATTDCFVPFPCGAEVAPAVDASVSGDVAASPINDGQPDPDPIALGGDLSPPPLRWKELAGCVLGELIWFASAI